MGTETTDQLAAVDASGKTFACGTGFGVLQQPPKSLIVIVIGKDKPQWFSRCAASRLPVLSGRQ
jgi:hypothetical protein